MTQPQDVDTSSPEVSLRGADGSVSKAPLSLSTSEAARRSVPWRNVRSARTSKHYAGRYWCATTRGHVVFESRLELARLLLADFDPNVEHIAGQPMLLTAKVAGRARRHVPDYMLINRDATVDVVNVKPAERLLDPVVRANLAWPQLAFEEIGWGYEEWTGTDAPTLANVRFLSAYRHADRVPDLPDVLAEVRDGDTIRSVEQRKSRHADGEVRAVLLRGLWTHDLETDLGVVLDGGSVLRRSE